MLKPTIDHNAIALRQLAVEDVTPRYVAWLNDAETVQYLEIRKQQPITRGQVRLFVRKCLKEGRHHWGIFDQRTDLHVGLVSCSQYDYDNRWVDISIVIGDPAYRGCGLSKIALAGAVDYLFSLQPLGQPVFNRIRAGAYSNNLVCIQAFLSLGFTKEAVFRQAIAFGHNDNQFIDDVKLGLLRSEWEQLRTQHPRAQVVSPLPVGPPLIDI